MHQAVLSGLLSNIGRRDDRRPQRDRRTRVEYQGARGARFEVVPGSAIGRAGSEWIVAAEVVETDRLGLGECRRFSLSGLSRSQATWSVARMGNPSGTQHLVER